MRAVGIFRTSCYITHFSLFRQPSRFFFFFFFFFGEGSHVWSIVIESCVFFVRPLCGIYRFFTLPNPLFGAGVAWQTITPGNHILVRLQIVTTLSKSRGMCRLLVAMGVPRALGYCRLPRGRRLHLWRPFWVNTRSLTEFSLRHPQGIWWWVYAHIYSRRKVFFSTQVV